MKINRKKINIALVRKEMSVTTLAKIYGVSRARMNVILNSREVSPISAGRLAKSLDVDVTEILEAGIRAVSVMTPSSWRIRRKRSTTRQ